MEPIEGAAAELALKKLATTAYGAAKYVVDLKSKRENLQNTMTWVEAELHDGDSMSEQCRSIDQRKLEDLSFQLDRWHDLSDLRASRKLQKQVMGGGNFTKTLRSFFSPSNQLFVSFKEAREVDDIQKKLNSIVLHHGMFGGYRSMPPHARSIQRVGSSSDILANFVVGRDEDRDQIVSMLSEESMASGKLSVVSIVGIGGMGKTALARYVYDDERMNHCFDVRFWVSVTENFDVMKVLETIISYGARDMPLNLCSMDQLRHHFRQVIGGKKFLLVVDNIWDRPDLRNKWLNLKMLLEMGANGSKVLITTRDRKVARVMDSNAPYMLGDLTKDASWLLFQKIAFTQWQEPGVEEIGIEIAKMCPRVPLVIRSIGGLLAEKQTVEQWHAVKDRLANIPSYGVDAIMHTLKISYDQLDETQKLCVTYCSLFEKGGKFSIDEMIHRWIALEYVKPTSKNQSLEDAGKECMTRLLNCGFLRLDVLGDAFRIHDVMYDVILSLAGFKHKVIESNTVEIDDRVRHISFWKAVTSSVSKEDFWNASTSSDSNEDLKGDCWEVPSSLFKIKSLQSLVRGSGKLMWRSNNCNYKLKVMNLSVCGRLISKFKSLRVLDLDRVGIKELPTSVGNLICLRFLNLRETEITKLPNSIIQLVNLQTLYLNDCDNLEELPRDMSNFLNLRHLMLKGCKKLRHMPMGLGKLINLRTLDTFIVGKQIESKASNMGKLADLDQLNNLSGSLDIKVHRESKYIASSEISSTNLKMKENLQDLSVSFKNGTKEDERVLECLQPPPSLKTLDIDGYGGERLACWMMDNIHNHLPNLKSIDIINCKSCKYLCSFGRLPYLKYLRLKGLEEVEYVEDITDSDNNENEPFQAPLFPSLEELEVRGMPKLKGWWRSEQDSKEDLHVRVQHHQHLVNWKPAFPRLHRLRVDSVELAITIARQIGGFTSLEVLSIWGSSTSEQSHQQQANTLALSSCFPNLPYLQFTFLELEVLPEEIRDLSSLQTLRIHGLFSLKAIPEWIDSLTSLQQISIELCPSLETLPQQIINLPNLKTLHIFGCPILKERCQSPNGEYWPFIQHIPDLDI